MAGAALPPSVSARAEEMVLMAHSGRLPPSLAAFKQQLLDQCQRVAASGDDHELRMDLDGCYSRGLSLRKSRVPTSAGSMEEYQQNPPWHRKWDDVREWEWVDVLVGGAEEVKVTSVCLLLALLPSLHPRLTSLDIVRLSWVKVIEGKWVAQAVEVLCAAMLSLSRQSANMITHLELDACNEYMMERGSVHLSHLLRSTHCNLLSLRLQGHKDDVPIEVEGGGGKLTPLGHIAQALQVNTTLTTLGITWSTLCTSTAHQIAALLSVNTILRRVEFGGVRTTEEGALYLRRALCGAQSGTTSKAPTIPFGSGALTTLQLWRTELGEKGASWVPWLGDMLAHNVSLQALDLSCSGLRDGAGRDVAEGLRQSNSSLKVLDITDNDDLTAQDMQDIFSALENHATLQIFKCGTSSWYMRQNEDVLIKQGSEGVEDMARALARMISRNRSLHTLEYPCAPFSATQWSERIVPALLANGTLKVIDFRGCKGISGVQVFQGLLHLIRTNTMILDLRLRETPLYESGQAQAIEEEVGLFQNFRKTLTALPTSRPTSARIILCGREYAGKSTLLRTIQQLLNSWSTTHGHMLKLAARKCNQLFKLQSPHDKELSERTRGVDIRSLDEIGGTRIHVWDLAGHREFHSLYDSMLSNSRNSATLFVFTYSPIISPIETGAGELKPMDRFKEEIRYWLQFLVSKSEAGIKPQVTVVITNKDRVKAHFKEVFRGYRNWKLGMEDTIVTIAQEEFANLIHLNSEPLIVNIRGRPTKDLELVKKWMDVNVKALQETLSRMQDVPTVCDEVGRVLSRSRICPIITKEDFFNICATKLWKFSQTKKTTFFRKAEKSTPFTSSLSEVQKLELEAVAACLYHWGEIIYDKNLHFIVTNPRWFGFGVLGHLLDLFAQDEDAGRTAHLPKNGFVTREILYRLLYEAAQTVPSLDQQQVNSDLLVDDLIKLMIRLHLCYERKPGDPSNTGYFIPTTFGDKDQKATDGLRSWEWVTPMEGAADKFMGKRLKCARPTTTFLTDGFFPRVQVMLYYLCINEKWVDNSDDTNLTLQKNLFRICVNSMEIVVEYSGHCAYNIDIMVKSPHKSHQQMNDFVDHHLLGAILKLCASQQGCQGVTLQEGIIRPACLQRKSPVVCAYRKDQAIEIERLREQVDRDPGYRHQWGAVKGEGGRVILQGGSDLGSVLLHGDPSCPTEDPEPPAQEDCYPDSNVKCGKRRGAAVIISMEKYKNGRNREGAQVDRGRLETLAENLKLVSYGNLLLDCPANVVREELIDLAQNRILTDDECVVCFVNGHGTTGTDGAFYFTDSDGSRISLWTDVVEPFAKCKNLVGKPKIFFVNACRGSLKLRSMEDTMEDTTDELGVSEKQPSASWSEGAEARYVEQVADCLLVFSTAHQAASPRDKEFGTNFVFALMRAVNKNRASKDLLTIVTLLNDDVVDMELKETDAASGKVRKVKQCVVFTSSLRKLVYWRDV